MLVTITSIVTIVPLVFLILAQRLRYSHLLPCLVVIPLHSYKEHPQVTSQRIISTVQ